MDIVAIIPAKGQSRRLPKKNIHPIWGKPMLYWAWKACQDSRFQIHTFVSTNSVEVIDCCIGLGIQTIDRGSGLSNDDTPKQAVIRDAAKFISLRYNPSIWISLQPNSPEIKGGYLDQAIDTLNKYDRDEVFSVNSNLMQNAAFRVFRGDYVFQKDLSTNCGVVVCDLMDVHDIDDVRRLEENGR